MDFMSIEVAAQLFLFYPSSQPTLSSDNDDFDFNELYGAEERDGGMAQTAVPFIPNHLHDLESLWWVAVWVVFYYYFSEGTTPRDRRTLQDAEDQLNLAKILFPLGSDRASLRDGLQNEGWFKKTCARLPTNKKAASFGLNILRGLLISHYKAIEANYPLIEPKASKDNIYDKFTKTFLGIKSESQDVVLDSIREIHAELSRPEKGRRRSESTAEAGAGDSQRMRT
jgi:hypothetical protein